jgi:P63C domain
MCCPYWSKLPEEGEKRVRSARVQGTRDSAFESSNSGEERAATTRKRDACGGDARARKRLAGDLRGMSRFRFAARFADARPIASSQRGACETTAKFSTQFKNAAFNFAARITDDWYTIPSSEFYKELFRLRRIPYAGSVKRPQYIGHLTNDLLYERLAPGVLVELRRLTPRDDRGRLKTHFHRRLSEDVGHPKLLQHLSAVTALNESVRRMGAV